MAAINRALRFTRKDDEIANEPLAVSDKYDIVGKMLYFERGDNVWQQEFMIVGRW